MARIQPIPLTRRNQLDQRFTFDSTTPDIDVLARPVDAVERTDVSSKASSLAKALGLMGQVGNNAIESYQRIQQHDEQQGSFLAMKGEDKPTEGQALIKGYEAAQGRLDAAKYRAELNEYFLNNQDALSPQEFQEGLEAISQKYLDEASSEDYLKSFLPQAQAAEDKLTLSYQEVVTEQVREQSINKVGQMLNDEVLNYLSESLGISSMEEVDEILEDPEEYLKLVGKTEVEVISEGIRNKLTEIQKVAQGMNIDRQTTSTILVQQMGELAVKYGLPDIMNFANIPDESKIALKNNPDLMKAIDDYKEQAQREQDRILELQDVEAQKKEKEAQTMFVNDITFRLTDMRLLQNEEGGVKKASDEAKAYLRELRETKEYQSLPASTISSLEANLEKIIAGQEVFKTRSTKPVFEDLLDKARNGDLTEEDVLSNSHNLSQTDYKGFLSFLDDKALAEQQAAQAAQNEAQGRIDDFNKQLDKGRNKYFQDTLDETISYIEDSYEIPNDNFGASMRSYMNQAYWEYLFTHDFRPPTLAETDKMVNDYLTLRGGRVQTVEQIRRGELTGQIEASNVTENQLTVKEQEAKNVDTEPIKQETNIPSFVSSYLGGSESTNGDYARTAYPAAAAYLDRQEKQAQQIAQATSDEALFQYDRGQVFDLFSSKIEGGSGLVDIAKEGIERGVFVPEEANLYVRAYTIDLIKKELGSKSITNAGSIIEYLQTDHGFTYMEATNMIQEALAVEIPDVPVEED